MADLPSYVSNRVVNGHCDCMFLHNAFQWPWARIAALVAPRPLLFVNSDHDRIFPMDANHRVINRMERIYSLFGAGDQVDSVVSMGGHAYRKDIRQAVYRFINTHLKADPSPINDSEVDLVTGTRENPEHPIEPLVLRVFPADSDIPEDELNTTIDEVFVPAASVTPPPPGKFESWKQELKNELRRIVFRELPQRIPRARLIREESKRTLLLETEPEIRIRLRINSRPQPEALRGQLLLVVTELGSVVDVPDWIGRLRDQYDQVFYCDARGVGETRWTRKNPPNYVERSHVLLGTTVDAGRVWDVAASSRYLANQHSDVQIHVAGEGGAGIVGAYAALWEPEIAALHLAKPP